jgi:type I restriction enzyme, S subunit
MQQLSKNSGALAMSFEWTLKRLGDCCEKIGSGSTPRGGKETYLDDGPVKLIRSQNVHNDGFSKSGLAFISIEQAEKLSNVSVQEGDVLLNITGDSVARVCQASKELLPARVNQHVAIIRPKATDIDANFLRYFLASPLQQNLMLGLASAGATRNALTKGMIEAFQIPCPPVSLQHSIANVLSILDDRITLLRESNVTLEAVAQALFKSWFLDFDPVCAKQREKKLEGMDESTAALFPNSFENSTLGEIPKGWEIKNLGQVAYNVKSRIKKAEDWKNLDLLDLSRMPRKILFPFEYGKGKELSTSVFEFKKDDCLFGAVRPYFHKVCHATRNGVTNSSVLVIRSVVPENQFFVNLVASSKECVTHATSYSQGTKMPTINWENLSRFSIVCPPDNLQSIFCEYVSPFFKKALNNSLIINLLTELRDALLPRLVMGQLKLLDSREINNKIKVKA